MPDQPGGAGESCARCGSGVPTGARYCTVCGSTLTTRTGRFHPPVTQPPTAPDPDQVQIQPAGVAVRSSAFLLDLAAMVSPALPLSVAGVLLDTAALVYFVVPVAFVAVWAFMQTWQGLSGTTFGKAMLGLRLVRVDGLGRPEVGSSMLRSALFGVTLGLAALPMKPDTAGRAGVHDRLTGLGVIDVADGANPLGARPQPPLRRVTADRGLHRVHAPVPVPTKKRG